MLTQLTVNGFKSLGMLRDLHLGQVNVFIGANGSGKSNLLEAIGLLGAAASGRIDDQSLLRRGVRPGVPALYKTSLKGTRVPPAIYLEGEWGGSQGVRYAVGINNPLSEPKPAWGYTTESVRFRGTSLLTRGVRGGYLAGKRWGKSGDLAPNRETGLAALARGTDEFSGEPASFFDALIDFAIFAPVTPVLRGIAPDPAPRAPVGLFGGRLPEALGPLLDRKAETFGDIQLAELFELLDWASDLSISPPSRQLLSPSVPTARFVVRFTDRRMIPERSVLSGYDASEGALYVLFMLVLAMHGESPRMLAIDNFDASLNPRLAGKIAKRFIDLVLSGPTQRQVFLTTHQPSALDGLDLSDDRIRLYAVERNPGTGATSPRLIRISPAILAHGGEKYSLSRLWTMGRLGAVPEL
ncbi:MAG: AAA family ATPase [Acidobacteriota bacterium]